MKFEIGNPYEPIRKACTLTVDGNLAGYRLVPFSHTSTRYTDIGNSDDPLLMDFVKKEFEGLVMLATYCANPDNVLDVEVVSEWASGRGISDKVWQYIETVWNSQGCLPEIDSISLYYYDVNGIKYPIWIKT